MKFVIFLCFVVTLFVDEGQGNVNDFFNNIGHAVSDSWDSLIEAIKRPVRQKRIGPGAKIKALRLRHRTSTTSTPFVWTDRDPKLFLKEINKTQASNIKVTLPLVLLPKYKKLENWINQKNAPKLTTEQNLNLLSARITHKPYVWAPKKSEIYLDDLKLKKPASDVRVTAALLSQPIYNSLEAWIKLRNEKKTTTPAPDPYVKGLSEAFIRGKFIPTLQRRLNDQNSLLMSLPKDRDDHWT